MAKLSESDATAKLSGLSGWRRDGDEIVKEFEFPDFLGSIGFVNRIATRAQAADHHPDMTIKYNHVETRLSTHSEGGLTAKDFALAAEIERAAHP